MLGELSAGSAARELEAVKSAPPPAPIDDEAKQKSLAELRLSPPDTGDDDTSLELEALTEGASTTAEMDSRHSCASPTNSESSGINSLAPSFEGSSSMPPSVVDADRPCQAVAVLFVLGGLRHWPIDEVAASLFRLASPAPAPPAPPAREERSSWSSESRAVSSRRRSRYWSRVARWTM